MDVVIADVVVVIIVAGVLLLLDWYASSLLS
jgi:hypothetical protein